MQRNEEDMDNLVNRVGEFLTQSRKALAAISVFLVLVVLIHGMYGHYLATTQDLQYMRVSEVLEF
jgi:hypothetical protein